MICTSPYDVPARFTYLVYVPVTYPLKYKKRSVINTNNQTFFTFPAILECNMIGKLLKPVL